MKFGPSIFALVAAAGLSACSTTAVAKTAGPSLRTLQHLLITRADFPRGWSNSAPVPNAGVAYPGTAIKSESQLVGGGAVGTAFTQRTETSSSFEYLAYRKAVLGAFENASAKARYGGSCRDERNGVVMDASVNTGLIETHTFGDWSLLLTVSNVVRGSKFPVGYMFVREGKYLVVIGYENVASLDVRTLEKLTSLAVGKIPVT
ncbi:MAG: hypothetical protein ACYDB2_08275 [Acidimicrobiales bacterium]